MDINPKRWISQDRSNFLSWINDTFKDFKLTGKNLERSNKKEAFRFQLFIRAYLQLDSPYRGLLIYHGLGSGKTCTSIILAENLKKDKNVLVLLPASLKSNFKTSLTSGECFTQNYKNDKNVELKYTLISTNAPNTAEKINELGPLDNYVIIVDEAHDVVSKVIGGGITGKTIYSKLKYATNSKIIFLTGTPIVNKPFEIAVIFNMLKGELVVPRFTFERVDMNLLSDLSGEINSLSYVNYCEVNLRLRNCDIYFTYPEYSPNYKKAKEEVIKMAFKKFNIQMKEFHTPSRYSLYPEQEQEFDDIFITELSREREKIRRKEILKRRMIGLVSYFKSGDKSKYPVENTPQYFQIPMSDFQFNEYSTVRLLEKKAEKQKSSGKTNLTSKKKKSKVSSMYRVYSRQFCNFVFPEDVFRPFPNPSFEEKVRTKKLGTNVNNNISNALNMEKSLNKSLDDNNEKKKVKKELQNLYTQRINESMEQLYRQRHKYLSYKSPELDKISPKMKEIYKNIIANPGLALVYSQFVKTEGLRVFSFLLEANNFKPLSLHTDLSNEPYTLRYALFTGEQTPQDKEKILDIFTSPENKNGELCKVILISQAGAQGLDLKNVRQVHIMEPFWHEVRIKQIIGRAVRYESHIDLPIKDRTVDVFRYLCKFTPEQEKEFINMLSGPKEQRERLTSDQYIQDVAFKKEEIIRETLKLMKESAVDCELNKHFNEEGIDCLNLGESDTISFYPNIKTDIRTTVTSEKKNKIKTIFSGKIGALLRNGIVVFKGKKGYERLKGKKLIPYEEKVTIDDFDKKVIYDSETRNIFDYDIYTKKKELLDLGQLNYHSKVI